MIHRFSVLLVLVVSGGLAGCTGPATTGAAANHPAQMTAIKGLFPVLEKDMPAAVVRQKLGPPAEITPMNAPMGKAEVWVYHFEKNIGMAQVATSTRDVPAFTMGLTGAAMTTVQEPVYTLAAQKSMVTLSLLMFNDRLAAQKAKVENRLDYDN